MQVAWCDRRIAGSGQRKLLRRRFNAAIRWSTLLWLALTGVSLFAVPQSASAGLLPAAADLGASIIQIDSAAVVSLASEAPGVTGFFQRLQARSSRSLARLGFALYSAATLWAWVLLSIACFVVVTAVASLADPRMLAVPRLIRLPGDLQRGLRLFLRAMWDRRMPILARAVVLLGLAYWLVPGDLIVDWPKVMPGFVDDLVIAVAVGKAFNYFCPDSVMARHAHAVSG